MAFPSSPVDGQSATVNNIVYVWSNANSTWTRTASGFVNLGASGNISAVGNVYGNFFVGNISGSVTNAQTVTVNAQPNITSVGTLTSVTSNGLISTTGNVSANLVLGNGSQLSNTNANTINTLFIGNTSTFYPTFVSADGGNNQSVFNSPFLTYVPTTGLLSTSSLSASGNVYTANIVATGNILPGANGVYSLGSPTALWASVYIGANTLYLGTVAVSANAASNTLSVDGSQVVTASSTGTDSVTGNVAITGNVSGGNILTTGRISSTGNITGNLLIGNGSLLTSITGANVTGTVPAATLAGTVTVNAQSNITSVGTLTSITSSGLISTTGNVVGNFIIGNGSLLTSITGANITGTVANAAFATSAGTATTANTAGTVTGNAQANITSVGTLTSLTVTGNTQSGNVLTAGLVSATGNITGNFFIGNGSQLTGIVVSAGNSIVNGNSNVTVSANSNVTVAVTGTTVATFATTGEYVTGVVSVSGNITGGNILTAGTVSAAGVIAQGTSSATAFKVTNITELGNIVAAAPSSTQTFYVASGATQLYTTAAANNWTLNIAFSAGTSLNTEMSVGDVITVTMLTTQGSTPYYCSAVQIDGVTLTSGTNIFWQGGTAPSAGNATGIDAYSFAIIKKASATYTVLASLTQF
jgi:hypothetical protein